MPIADPICWWMVDELLLNWGALIGVSVAVVLVNEDLWNCDWIWAAECELECELECAADDIVVDDCVVDEIQTTFVTGGDIVITGAVEVVVVLVSALL